MTAPATINTRIIDALYTEALALSDEVRGAFDLSGRLDIALAGNGGPTPTLNACGEDVRRIALSCEALRTTTRMMHAVAWLLNHRAYLMGELSAFQLRRHGRLSPDPLAADPERVELLPADLQELIGETQGLYARLLRLDQAFRAHQPSAPTAIEQLHQRLSNQRF